MRLTIANNTRVSFCGVITRETHATWQAYVSTTVRANSVSNTLLVAHGLVFFSQLVVMGQTTFEPCSHWQQPVAMLLLLPCDD